MRFWVHTAEKCALPPGPLALALACLAPHRGVYSGNPILQETELGEYLSHIVGGVVAFGLRLRGRTQCVLPRKRKPNATTPWGIHDKYSPDRMMGTNFVSYSIKRGSLYMPK
jgi:hypothetical protein